MGRDATAQQIEHSLEGQNLIVPEANLACWSGVPGFCVRTIRRLLFGL